MGIKAGVSVIMPVRNGEAFIAAALRSVLAELMDGDELIVVDDASDDGTSLVVRNAAPNALYLKAAAPGVSGARNTGLRAAKGELIAFLDCDDLWPAGRQRALRDLLESDLSLNAVAGRIRISVQDDTDDLAAIDGAHAPSILMTCLYRRALIDCVGFFDEGLHYGEDLDYHWRLMEAGMRIAFSEHDSLIYRRHSGNVTNAAPPRQLTIMKLLARRAARHRNRASAATLEADAHEGR
jgi:glycosyltransferase involved in cell wall biosynthesis